MSAREESRSDPRRRTPASAEAELRAATEHARNALAEATSAARCLIEAAALGATGRPAAEQDLLAALVRGLDRAHGLLEAERPPHADRWMARVSEALEAEIARWEERGRDDPEARAVLRAFLGVRELLWEFGLRPATSAAPPESPGERPRERLQRVPVEG